MQPLKQQIHQWISEADYNEVILHWQNIKKALNVRNWNIWILKRAVEIQSQLGEKKKKSGAKNKEKQTNEKKLHD